MTTIVMTHLVMSQIRLSVLWFILMAGHLMALTQLQLQVSLLTWVLHLSGSFILLSVLYRGIVRLLEVTYPCLLQCGRRGWWLSSLHGEFTWQKDHSVQKGEGVNERLRAALDNFCTMPIVLYLIRKGRLKNDE